MTPEAVCHAGRPNQVGKLGVIRQSFPTHTKLISFSVNS